MLLAGLGGAAPLLLLLREVRSQLYQLAIHRVMLPCHQRRRGIQLLAPALVLQLQVEHARRQLLEAALPTFFLAARDRRRVHSSLGRVVRAVVQHAVARRIDLRHRGGPAVHRSRRAAAVQRLLEQTVERMSEGVHRLLVGPFHSAAGGGSARRAAPRAAVAAGGALSRGRPQAAGPMGHRQRWPHRRRVRACAPKATALPGPARGQLKSRMDLFRL